MVGNLGRRSGCRCRAAERLFGSRLRVNKPPNIYGLTGWQGGLQRAMVGSRSEGGLGVELARVYVSSTIADLTEERRAVLDWLRLARHQAVDSYLPDSDTVRDSCLDDVASV